jgi:uncharacterized protein
MNSVNSLLTNKIHCINLELWSYVQYIFIITNICPFLGKERKKYGKKIAIIGHFPFIPKLQSLAEKVWVIEKNPKKGDLTEDRSETFIPQADVVGITGTAITNHTIEHLLALCNPEAYMVVLGDSAPLSPVLFNYGIDAISGTKVIAPELALRCVSEGATYRQIKGILKLILIKDKSG